MGQIKNIKLHIVTDIKNKQTMSVLQCYIRRPILLRKQFVALCCKRWNSNAATKTNICALTNRAVVEVNGKDSVPLLQGLITNNMNSLNQQQPSIYAMLLNDKGRIVHDLIVYRGTDDPTRQFFVECDVAEDQSLVDLLLRYKLRKKVALKTRKDMEVFSLFPSSSLENSSLIDLEQSDMALVYKDPRLPELGARILTDDSKCLLGSNIGGSTVVPLDVYTRHRYRLGVGEGASEVGGGIPLEHNIEWLNGVAFDKGCYIGQELVARVHFTGQVRKRVMPMCFDGSVDAGVDIRNAKGRKIGRVLGCTVEDEVGRYVGIGVVNVEQGGSEENLSFDTTTLEVARQDGGTVKVVTNRPHWWPQL